ncbi:HPF/RaiA family ribosome-associated protein [Comamonas aquatica]|uniref:HPF/RaiA family ribosome-associated protein n=1 Tax=Comamonas aquatica TaxID=225991 RepID=UPI0023EDC2BD|nr:HPF/RaiA family ribosome-associated protein [Comamonas aquatica]
MVDIHSQGFAMTDALAQHVRRRLGFMLTRHSHRIKRVLVRIGDENGPRGGPDKFCRMQVYLLNASAAVVEEVGVDLYATIDRAAERVGREVVKHLDRTHPLRNTSRQGPRPSRNRYVPLDTVYLQGDRA